MVALKELVLQLMGKTSLSPHPGSLRAEDIPYELLERKWRLERIIRDEARLIEELARRER